MTAESLKLYDIYCFPRTGVVGIVLKETGDSLSGILIGRGDIKFRWWTDSQGEDNSEGRVILGNLFDILSGVRDEIKL